MAHRPSEGLPASLSAEAPALGLQIDQTSAAFIALVQASAGAAGAVVASMALQPVEVAKTRIQISTGGDDSTLQTLRKIAAADGFLGLWLGAWGKCAENGAKNFAYFYIYDGMNALAKRQMEVTTLVKLILGYVAGVGNTLMNMPLEVISTKMQLDDAKGISTFGMLRRIVRHEGVGTLYTGLGYNIALCINPAIQNTILDKLKEGILKHMQRKNPQVAPALTAFQAFTLGAIAKAVATVLTYPLVRLKTNLQAGKVPTLERQPSLRKVTSKTSKGSQPAGMERSGSVEMIRALSFREDKEPEKLSLWQRFVELYRGVGSALLKSTLQSALLYMVKDQVEFTVERFFHLSAEVFYRKTGQLKLGGFSGRPLAS
ncbi:unnamed protein product [Durusdinium trenchii]|uniref:Peroxisomal membrane protein PMP34 (34 kDa peroxisomal membrane protein) (Solute carrier family 25 member 17) n=2 Tax=Durusdinium trenchii TaxID=1381693 RepID=A0ABP0MW46_9DINO